MELSDNMIEAISGGQITLVKEGKVEIVTKSGRTIGLDYDPNSYTLEQVLEYAKDVESNY